VDRCSQTVKSVLQFARQQETEKWSLDLNDSIRRARDLTRADLSLRDIDTDLNLADALPKIHANATSLDQVFVNLIHNAANSSPEGACVTIRTLRAEDKVRVRVEDRGCGMSEHEILHAFDPFFTTRIHDGGTGLGLSVCHGIIIEHGGSIEIESRGGGGTTIIVDFPLGDARG
jgi:signal transduction histidine kinase